MDSRRARVSYWTSDVLHCLLLFTFKLYRKYIFLQRINVLITNTGRRTSSIVDLKDHDAFSYT